MAYDGGERTDRHVTAGGIEARVEGARRRLAGVERELWALAVLALLGDLLLTYLGLERGLTEANPVARAGLEQFGYVALVVLKGAAMAVGVVGWAVLPRRFGAIVPLALAIPWTTAVVVNAVMLATVA